MHNVDRYRFIGSMLASLSVTAMLVSLVALQLA